MSIYSRRDVTNSLGEVSFDIESMDPSLNGYMAHSLEHQFELGENLLRKLFFDKYEIGYLCDYTASASVTFRVVTHPYETDTCFEKAELLGSWNPLNVIKALYLEDPSNNSLYGAVIPETGCFLNRTRLRDLLDLPREHYLKKATTLPHYMSFGTCSPFISMIDLIENGGKVKKILFDSQTLKMKRKEKSLDDFSFGMDHRVSLQINYCDCYEILQHVYPEIITEREILSLSFKEKLVRKNGKINITFEFGSLDYNTSMFINSIHGYGEVSVLNDYLDELDDATLPTRKSSFVDSRQRYRENH